MFLLFIALTALSLVALIGGMVWTLVASGQTRRRSGPEVGAEIIAEQMAAEEPEAQIVEQVATFKGQATKIESEASFSFAEIKELVVAGQWQRALPILLAIGGFLGLFLFGSLTLWLGVKSKLIGGLVVIAAFYVLIRTVIAFARA